MAAHRAWRRGHARTAYTCRYNACMKMRLLMLSLLAMFAYWYWVGRASGPGGWREGLRRAYRSVAVGISVYFLLLVLMLLYLFAGGS